MNEKLIALLRESTETYCRELNQSNSSADKKEIQNIASIAESLALALEAGDMFLVTQKLGGFSRSVSDAYCTQPTSFKVLAKNVSKIKLMVI